MSFSPKNYYFRMELPSGILCRDSIFVVGRVGCVRRGGGYGTACRCGPRGGLFLFDGFSADMKRFSVTPSASGLLRICGGDFVRTLREVRACERDGRGREACRLRFEAVQRLIEGLDDDARLDWDDDEARAAMELLYASAADHLSAGNVEMAAAIWERLTECDEEDRLEAVVMLAFCYPVLGEWECFDEAMFDIPMKSPEYSLLTLWCGFCRCGGIDRDALRMLRTRHKAWYGEFVAAEHPATEEFLAEIRGERPSPQAEARELWFATVPLWTNRPDFIEALRKA